MTLEQFCEENQDLIDSVIRAACGDHYQIDDDDREDFVMNDEGLYLMAQEFGVDV